MSVTFQPYVNIEKISSPDQLTWTASWIQRCKWQDLPDRFKKLGRMDEKLWKLGHQNLQIWRGLADSLGMQLHDDWPGKKIWVDNVPWNVVLVVFGEDKTHTGQEIQLSNSNAHALCQFLGISESGNMNPIALLKKIEKAKSGGKETEFTTDYSDTQEEIPGSGNGPRMIDFGLGASQIQNYLLHLEQLCDHCIKNECDVAIS